MNFKPGSYVYYIREDPMGIILKGYYEIQTDDSHIDNTVGLNLLYRRTIRGWWVHTTDCIPMSNITKLEKLIYNIKT